MLRCPLRDTAVPRRTPTHELEVIARPLLARAGELRDSVSAYDAQYVSLAEVLEALLLTADGRLARAPGLRCVVQLLR